MRTKARASKGNVEGKLPNHAVCPACGAGLHMRPNQLSGFGPLSAVFRCRQCSAVFGVCTREEATELVIPAMSKEDAPPEYWRCYDLQVFAGSQLLERRHGWFDLRTRLILQIG
jgi:hypothetical protein